LPEGFTLENGIIAHDGSYDEGEWTVTVSLAGVDGYLSLTAPVVIRIVEPIHASGDLSALKVGEETDITFDAPYYTYGSYPVVSAWYENTITDADGNPVDPVEVQGSRGTTHIAGTGDPVGGSWNIYNWYWKNAEQKLGSGSYDVIGHLAFADIQATDARYIDTADVVAGNYYKAFLYGYSVSEEDQAKLAEYGLAAEPVITSFAGYQGINYDINSALRLTGVPAKAGEVTFTVTLNLPLVRGLGNRFPNFNGLASPVVTEITRTVTLTIAE